MTILICAVLVVICVGVSHADRRYSILENDRAKALELGYRRADVDDALSECRVFLEFPNAEVDGCMKRQLRAWASRPYGLQTYDIDAFCDGMGRCRERKK